MRADPRTCPIPMVMLISSREEHDLVRGYETGANSYIVKPVDFENFSAALAEAGHFWQLVSQEPS